MNILIVEDDDNKRNQVVGFISSSFDNAKFIIARSLQSGLRSAIEGDIELIILDMTMPTFDISLEEDGGRPQAYAGREILRQMKRRKINIPVIVLTQFDRFGEGKDSLTLAELDAQLKDAHSDYYLGAIYYDVSSERWKDELNLLIKTSIKGYSL